VQVVERESVPSWAPDLDRRAAVRHGGVPWESPPSSTRYSGYSTPYHESDGALLSGAGVNSRVDPGRERSVTVATGASGGTVAPGPSTEVGHESRGKGEDPDHVELNRSLDSLRHEIRRLEHSLTYGRQGAGAGGRDGMPSVDRPTPTRERQPGGTLPNSICVMSIVLSCLYGMRHGTV
jgi:hypothetical protein